MTTEATAIRDRMFALAQTLPGYTKFRKVPVRQISVADCPCVSVITAEEDATADGDVTAGPPHFVHEASYHLSVLRTLTDPLTLDGQIDADLDALQNLILRDVTLNGMIEGVASMRRSRAYPQDGEAYFVELRFEITVQFRSLWNPVIPDAFTGLDVDSRPPGATDWSPYIPLTIDVEAS